MAVELGFIEEAGVEDKATAEEDEEEVAPSLLVF